MLRHVGFASRLHLLGVSLSPCSWLQLFRLVGGSENNPTSDSTGIKLRSIFDILSNAAALLLVLQVLQELALDWLVNA